jgi:hypothetical protein
MSKLVDWILRASKELGLFAEAHFALTASSGEPLKSIVRIYNVGARNGMLVFPCYEEIQGHERELVAAGYAYSVMDEPRAAEEFNLESFKEMFIDWGWTGDVAAMPTWMVPPKLDE